MTETLTKPKPVNTTDTANPIRPFDHLRTAAWPYRFRLTLQIRNIAGGIPTDPKVAEGWLRTKLGDTDDVIREAVATTMIERNVTAQEATQIVDQTRHLNGFKRTPETGQLYIEGRQLKAAIKEATNVAVASGKLKGTSWGVTNKGSTGFIAEHVVVDEDVLPLWNLDGTPITQPTEVLQRFVHTWRGDGIQYEEVCADALIVATIESDWDFDGDTKHPNYWALMWLTGEQQGLGASRSQGMGRYEVVSWERLGD